MGVFTGGSHQIKSAAKAVTDVTGSVLSALDTPVNKVTQAISNTVDSAINCINKVTDSAFACLEKKTGLGDGNSIYKAIKDSIKKSIGISEGHVKGITGMITGTLQFASKNNPMLQPLRMVNKITDFVNDPNKYIDKAISINNTLSILNDPIKYAMNNPVATINALQSANNYYSQMQADPYKAGQFQGEVEVGIASLLIPGGAGLAGKAGEAGEAANIIGKTEEIISAEEKVGAISETASNPLFGACFVAGTKVITEQGNKSIEEIRIGDRVLSQNVYTGEKAYKKVKNVFVKEVDTLVHLEIEGTKIDTTVNHKFWTIDKGWTDAGKLIVGDKVLLSSGKIATVDKVFIEKLDYFVKVYNFEVSDWHTYFVADIGVLVHNDCAASIEGAVDAKTYQTYTKTNPTTGEVYSGRTSGKGTPAENVAKRDANHHMNDKGFGPAEFDKTSSNKNAIRGREQQLIEANGGAKSQGGTSGNAINGIGPNNEKKDIYIIAAEEAFK